MMYVKIMWTLYNHTQFMMIVILGYCINMYGVNVRNLKPHKQSKSKY